LSEAAPTADNQLDIIDASNEATVSSVDLATIESGKCACVDKRSQLCTVVKQTLHSSNKRTDRERANLVEAWYSEVSRGVSEDQTHSYDRVYFPHHRAVAGAMGLNNQALDKTRICGLLLVLKPRQNEWDELQSGATTKLLFLKPYQIGVSKDDLASYRFVPNTSYPLYPQPDSPEGLN
jgi:hypothetical protein